MRPVPISEYLSSMREVSSGDRQPPPRRESAPVSLRAVTRNDTPVQRPQGERGISDAQSSPAALADNPQRWLADWLPKSPDTGSAGARDVTFADNVEVRIKKAYERGLKHGSEAAQSIAEERRASDLTMLEEKNLKERRAFQGNEYAQVAAAIKSGFAEIEESIGATVARILVPFIETRLIKQIVQELGDSLAQLHSDRAAGLIRISGPEHLLARLRASVSSHAVSVEYVANEQVDVTIESRNTIIESHLQSWTALLASIDD